MRACGPWVIIMVLLKNPWLSARRVGKPILTINPGPRAYVNDVNITINGAAHDDPEFQSLRDSLLKTKGSPLDHGQYERMKRRIESLALERGYLKGTFTENKLLIDKELNKAHIKLVFDAGKRMVFGTGCRKPGYFES